MTSVAAPQTGAGSSIPTQQPNPEFVKAMTLTDATMLVAGSMIGSGIFIVSASMARTLGRRSGCSLAWIAHRRHHAARRARVWRARGDVSRAPAASTSSCASRWVHSWAFSTGGRFFSSSRRAPSPPSPSRSAASSACSGPAISRRSVTAGSRRPTSARRGSGAPIRRTRSSSASRRSGSSRCVSIAVLTWINLRGVREGKLVQTTLTVVKTGALALLILLGLTIGRNATAIAANFGGGNFVGSRGRDAARSSSRSAPRSSGSLFSSDAWNNVTFAAAEVQNPKRNLPLALVLGTGLVTLLYVLANVAYLNVLPMHGAADGATALARGISHATQDRVGHGGARGRLRRGAARRSWRSRS